MPPFVFCETWDKWELEIQEMHWAVEIWRMLGRGDGRRPVRGMFNGLLASHRIPRCGYSAATRNCVVLHRTFSSSLTRPRRARSRQSDRASSRFLFKPGDFVTPAWFLVQRWINEKLRGNSGPQLRYRRRAGYWRVLQIFPYSLLAAMWLQFVQAIASKRKYRPCKECSGWFEVSTDDTGKRINREFCSDPCKSK